MKFNAWFAAAMLLCTFANGARADCKILIGVDLPQSDPATIGIPVFNGIVFAVDDRWHWRVAGCRLDYVNYDDIGPGGPHDGTRGVANVRSMIANPLILGMVGPMNSAIARAEIPVANKAALALVSPANTNPCLTKVPEFASGFCGFTPQSLRPFGPNNYFRVITSDDTQGPAMARYALKTLGVRAVAIINDDPDYGTSLSNLFAEELAAGGGAVVARQDLTAADYTSFLRAARNAGAQAVYYGGGDCSIGSIRDQMDAVFPADTPLLGNDSLQDCHSAGVFTTVPGVDADHRRRARHVLSEYRQAYPLAADYNLFTMAGYDAANALISAIAGAAEASGGVPTREQVRAALAAVERGGVWGPISFDANGDTNNRAVTILATDSAGSQGWAATVVVGGASRDGD